LRETELFFQSVLDKLCIERTSSSIWHRRRQKASVANNHLYASVQRMAEEPPRHRFSVALCFKIAAIIIRLNREITSVALMGEKMEMNGDKYRTPGMDLVHDFGILNTMLTGTSVMGVHELRFSKSPFAGDEQDLIRNQFRKIGAEIESLFLLIQELSHERDQVK
jgi:hypothetical protein